MKAQVAVCGAGVLGRLISLGLVKRGLAVTLFDRGDWSSRDACSFAAAGLLAPLAEAVSAGEPALFRLGKQSMELWSNLFRDQVSSVTMTNSGTLALAREPDLAELVDFRHKLARVCPEAPLTDLDARGVWAKEPAFQGEAFRGLFLPDEGRIDNHQALTALAKMIAATNSITLRLGVEVAHVAPREVHGTFGCETFDTVIDTRGFWARDDLPDLRGVRGEIIELRASEVQLTRPVRFLHQRYPLYVVPRGKDRYVVGATCLESESLAPMTVKSALELLGAAYSLHPGFRYAEITGMVANCRPAFPDNLPRLLHRDGILRVNGLYRHGFLLAPVMAEAACRLVVGEDVEPDVVPFVRKEA